MLVSKLPNGSIDRWNKTAYNIRKRQECEPSLSEMIEFVDQETTLVNDLMFSRKTLEWYNEKSEKPNGKRYKREKSLAIETKTGGHDIEECNELKKLRSKVFFKGTPNY